MYLLKRISFYCYILAWCNVFGTADNGVTSSVEQHPAHMRYVCNPVLTEIGFSFMALTLSAVVYMPNLETSCLFFFEVGYLVTKYAIHLICVSVYSMSVAYCI